MGTLLGPLFPEKIGLAVSGGGDSMAMLYLAAPWARRMGITLRVCTVDHHLRPDSADEARMVAQACAELGLVHTTLHWHWDGVGNVSDAGRRARLALIAAWRGDMRHILMAHTRDDQAETVMMRLARGSGVDGLSGMAPIRRWSSDNADAFDVVRPLLNEPRAELRHYCKVLQIPFVDDPTNDDPSYERVKVRQSWDWLGDLGITRQGLANTARTLADAQEALNARARDVLDRVWLNRDNALFDIVLDRDGLAQVETETRRRLIAAALMYVAAQDYRPRLSALDDAIDRSLSGAAVTLHGCLMLPHKGHLFVCRELAAVKPDCAEPGHWDVYRVDPALRLRPLGPQGAAQLRGVTTLPARVLWPTPGVFEEDRVVAAPRIGFGPQIPVTRDGQDLPAFLDAH